MKIYLGLLYYHFKKLQDWGIKNNAQVTLNVNTFAVEVKCRGRYYTLYPMFAGEVEGRRMYVSTMPPSASGFCGWRPYGAMDCPHSKNKILFKNFLREKGIRTPEYVEHLKAAMNLDFDYIVKNSNGSFGRQIDGPFRKNETVDPGRINYSGSSETAYAEQFIEGSIVKVWFWGNRAFYAQVSHFPEIVGDGRSTSEKLVSSRFAQCALDWGRYAEREVIVACLRFQNTELHDIVSAGRSLWIDYRYGRDYEPNEGSARESDNALSGLIEKTGNQIPVMGAVVNDLLRQSFPAPILVALDAMLDANGHLWWLEMNVNPMVPPECYEIMFLDLFP
jgi:hypothetical protein